LHFFLACFLFHVTQPGRAALGLAVTAVGVPFFFVWRAYTRDVSVAAPPDA